VVSAPLMGGVRGGFIVPMHAKAAGMLPMKSSVLPTSSRGLTLDSLYRPSSAMLPRVSDVTRILEAIPQQELAISMCSSEMSMAPSRT